MMTEDVLDKSWTACQNGDLVQVRELFGQLGSFEVQILLQRAVTRNFLEPARFLLEQGADPTTTPLISIVEQCPIEMLQLLSEFGMDFKSAQNNLLLYAINRREVMDWLLDQGLNINLGGNRTLKGRDKLYRDNTVAVLNEAAASGDIDLFDHLVARGAKPPRSNALHHATRCKDSNKVVAMISHLIEKYDLDVNADPRCGGLNDLVEFDYSPGSPLNCAVAASNVAAADTLIKYGANIGNAEELTNSPEMKKVLGNWR